MDQVITRENGSNPPYKNKLFSFFSKNHEIGFYTGILLVSLLLHVLFFVVITWDRRDIDYEEILIAFPAKAPVAVAKPINKIVLPRRIEKIPTENNTLKILKEEKEIEEIEEKKEVVIEQKNPAEELDEDVEVTEDEINFTPFYSADKRPAFSSKAALIYPFKEKRQNKEGVVLIEVDIDSTGRMRNYRIVKSAGTNFDNAAIAMVVESTYSPGFKDGKAIAVRMRFPIIFKIE